MTDTPVTPAPVADDFLARFQIETLPVHGKIVRLGSTIDAILSAHAYPDLVANLLGEACALAVLIGSALKHDGRLILQAQGDGPVAYVVADYDTSGHLRGFCRFNAEAVAALADAAQGHYAQVGAKALLGKGTFIMTIDPGAGLERYQGVTPIEGESLALCAEAYFAQSEQIPTRVRLAVARHMDATGARWRAGGALIQYVASDEARGDTREAWEHCDVLFRTLGEDELVDPDLSADRLLYRLFHEDGVRMNAPQPVEKFCRCSQERIEALVQSFPVSERAEMAEDDGQIRVTCEYCSTVYTVDPAALDADAHPL